MGNILGKTCHEEVGREVSEASQGILKLQIWHLWEGRCEGIQSGRCWRSHEQLIGGVGLANQGDALLDLLLVPLHSFSAHCTSMFPIRFWGTTPKMLLQLLTYFFHHKYCGITDESSNWFPEC